MARTAVMRLILWGLDRPGAACSVAAAPCSETGDVGVFSAIGFMLAPTGLLMTWLPPNQQPLSVVVCVIILIYVVAAGCQIRRQDVLDSRLNVASAGLVVVGRATLEDRSGRRS